MKHFQDSDFKSNVICYLLHRTAFEEQNQIDKKAII
jgi:hypothetical protein